MHKCNNAYIERERERERERESEREREKGERERYRYRHRYTYTYRYTYRCTYTYWYAKKIARVTHTRRRLNEHSSEGCPVVPRLGPDLR